MNHTGVYKLIASRVERCSSLDDLERLNKFLKNYDRAFQKALWKSEIKDQTELEKELDWVLGL